MAGFSEKVYLRLPQPVEDAPVSDQRRLLLALEEQGYANVSIPLPVLRRLYTMCRETAVTVTLVYREHDWVVTAVEPGDQRQHHYALAVDYGSTTVIMQLVDMNSGTVIAREKEINGQVAYGTDILSRITYAMAESGNRARLRQATVKTFENLLDRLTEQTGIPTANCPVMIVSGNTAMVHFLLELDAWTVFAAPYAPVTADPGWLWGSEVGMEFEGMMYFIPAASNYIGGDIVSGMLKLDIHKKEETGLFFDIGTNGELVIGNRDWLMAGAGAAGPALEGYISRYGMRAAEGAVDTVRIHGDDLRYTTIGGGKPVGICGSGIIDLLAQMRLNGWIDIAGDLNPAASGQIIYLEEEDQYAAVYAGAEESALGRPLFFTQTDIRQYLDTKAAAYTMIECLLDSAGCDMGEVARCYLSGAFAAHSDLESAITIGVFPDLPRERYMVLDNTSLEGATILLLDRARLREVHWIAETMYCVQFASVPDFLVRMQAAKFIPHTDLSRYPNITARLENSNPGK